jgi:capsular exopolysaccharide synthesis family protein
MSLTPGAPTAAPPAALGSAPNAVALLKALRRCWVRAAAVGVVLAGAAAVGAWYFVPPSKHLARTLMRVPASSTILFHLSEAVPPLPEHQRTQMALVKSRMVLNAALKRPGVSELAVIKAQPEPIEWLEKEVVADFSVAPEILRIAVSGDNPDEMKALVKALREAYQTEVLDKERIERNARLEMLGKKREEYTEKLRDRQRRQRELEQAGVPKDVGMRNFIQSFVQSRLGAIEKELIATQSDLRKSTIELAAQKAAEKALPTATISGLEVQALVDKEPDVVKAQGRVNEWKVYVAECLKRAVKGEAEPTVQAARKSLAETEQTLAKLKKDLTPSVIEQVRAQRQSAAAVAVQQLEGKVELLKAQEKELAGQVDTTRQDIARMASNTVQHDAIRDETATLVDLVKKITDEEEKLRFELQAPDRFSTIEDAVVLRTSDDKRLITAAAGAFAATLGMVLLGFAFLEFRTRRIDSVDEVVHGLGMNLVGAIPDSTAQAATPAGANGEAAAHNTLAEAVDATRVMLLRAARSEGLRVVMVTSAHSGEGKTSLSTHLAASLAQAGLRTLLIDGDLRNPIAHEVFGVEFGAGFCELLRGEATADAVIRPTPVDRLSLMTAGRWNSRASRALAQEGVAAAVVGQLREQFDFVVIDSSPVLPVVDPLLIGQLADGTILSVLRDVSRMPSVYAAPQRLTAGGVRVLGAVVNGVRGEAYGAAYPYRQRVEA